MDKIKKFLNKLSKKDRTLFLKIFKDIKVLKLGRYDVKPLKGYKDVFRLRKGKVRIVFVKTDGCGILVDIIYRKDAYKE